MKVQKITLLVFISFMMLSCGNTTSNSRIAIKLCIRRFLFPDGAVPGYGSYVWVDNQGSNLREVVIPDNSIITGIPEYAFQKNSLLEKVTIPAGITDIGTYAFYNCASLCEIHVKATTPPTIRNTTLNGVASQCKTEHGTGKNGQAYVVAEGDGEVEQQGHVKQDLGVGGCSLN